jgi:hypothetical protein
MELIEEPCPASGEPCSHNAEDGREATAPRRATAAGVVGALELELTLAG